MAISTIHSCPLCLVFYWWLWPGVLVSICSLDSLVYDVFSQSVGDSYNILGPGCSKLTTSLLNVTLKFETLISEICQYFLLKKWEQLCSAKASLIFFNKKISVYLYKVVKHLMSWSLNELVKLMMLWTTGPRCLHFTFFVEKLSFHIYIWCMQPFFNKS